MSVIHLGTDGHIYTGDRGGCLIAEVAHGIGDESFKGEWGRRIVRAVNLHDELVAACRAWMEFNRETSEEHPVPDLALRSELRKKAKALTVAVLKKAEAP